MYLCKCVCVWEISTAVKENKHGLSANQTADYVPIISQAALLFVYWRHRRLFKYKFNIQSQIDKLFETNQNNCGFVVLKHCYCLLIKLLLFRMRWFIYKKSRAASILQHKIKWKIQYLDSNLLAQLKFEEHTSQVLCI